MTQTDKQAGRQTATHTNHTHRDTCMYRQTDRHTHTYVYRQIDKQTDTHNTDRHTHIIYIYTDTDRHAD